MFGAVPIWLQEYCKSPNPQMPGHGEHRQRGRASPRYYAQLYESASDEDVEVASGLSTLFPR
jgi:hypothetical protein